MLIWVRARKKAYRLFYLTLLLALGACSSASSDNKLGEELCAIYGSALSKSTGSTNWAQYRAEKVSKYIERDLPKYYKKHHVNIAAAAPSDQYALAKMAVKHESGSDWDCRAMKQYLGVE